MRSNAKKLSDVVDAPVQRISWTYEELDWAYGRKAAWGAPVGGISLWSGGHGTGKSRLVAQIMRRLNERGLASLINQGEVTAAQFKAEKFAGVEAEHVYLSEDMSIYGICEAIREVKPALFFCDSIQMVKEAKGDAGIKYVIPLLKKALNDAGSHAVLISQLTKDGTTKGTTGLPHLVDIECYLERWAPTVAPSLFAFRVKKNRYGKSGGEVIFAHKDWGVECESNNRLNDSDWFDVSSYGPKDGDLVLPEEVPRPRWTWRSLFGWRKPRQEPEPEGLLGPLEVPEETVLGPLPEEGKPLSFDGGEDGSFGIEAMAKKGWKR